MEAQIVPVIESEQDDISRLLPLPFSRIDRFSELCEIFTASRRTGLIHVISRRPSTPSELNTVGLGLSFSGVSQHLSKAKSGGWILEERNGQSITYRINPLMVEEFRSLIDTVLPP
jgi:DNA-binding transcriptional ArsR family regulator